MAKKSVHEVLIKEIHARTEAWAEQYFKKDEKQTEKSKGMSKLLGEMSLGKTDKDKMAKLLSLVSGESVIIEGEDEIEFDPLVAIVLTKLNTTDFKHTYSTDKVILSLGDGVAMEDGATSPGSMIPKKLSGMRPATTKEIDELSEKFTKAFAKEANILVSIA